MVYEAPPAPVDAEGIVPLGAARCEDVLALTARVYPHCFRARTMEMGRYFGICRDGWRAAMIGERLGDAGSRGMSAICTHPDCTGQGRLTAWLTGEAMARGRSCTSATTIRCTEGWAPGSTAASGSGGCGGAGERCPERRP